MNITLQVEGTQLSNEVKDVLASLTEGQKREMAGQLLLRTLQDCDSKFRKGAAIQLALDELNKELPEHKFAWELSTRYHTPTFELHAKGQYHNVETKHRERFEELKRHHSHVNEYFYTEVFDEMDRLAKQKIKEMVEGSDVVKEAIAQAVAGFKDRVPELVMQAMMALFFDNMKNAMSEGSMAILNTRQTQSQLDDLRKRLNA